MNSISMIRLIALSGVWLLAGLEAAAACEPVAGGFVAIEGAVEVEARAAPGLRAATLDQTLCNGDVIHVRANSRAALSLANEAVLRLDQHTTLRLVDIGQRPEKRSFLQLLAGAFKSFSRAPRTMTVNTPYVNGMIEGTEFEMRVADGNTVVSVVEGRVKTENQKGGLTLKPGESSIAAAGQAPRPYLQVHPLDAVQWTLYFPPILAALGGSTRHIPADLPLALRSALERASRGDAAGALAVLDRVPVDDRDARFHQYRAALLLNVGQAAQARADIETAVAQNPGAGLPYALRAIVEIARNERPQALADAERAVAAGPSAAAYIALSYALQAEFRIEAARDSLLAAAQRFPDDPLVQARLSELWLMLGERRQSLQAAQQAEKLAPNLGLTQVVLGFSALAALRTDQAETAFRRAIAIDSADPLAYLGLGLAEIKDGRLREGRRDLEKAVALNPGNSLLRSYLGKAYFEEKRRPLDEQQFEIAKRLDPTDPTPYLYDAINKQTTNRPVEALHDLQKSIDLNGNRAVYRSRQLLDADLAARGASVGRVYNDLGFQALALREGWKSLNYDPTNFSAHRFLADSYAVLPRHEIARVSELLQSQLLQPLNVTPIQPRLAESNLFLISTGGPGTIAFNEFNPIFSRDGLRFLGSGLVGSNGTSAAEGIVSGIHRKASFSVGYSNFGSDGFRSNYSQQDNIANAFVQYALSPDANIQFEYRNRRVETGDLQLNFFRNDILPYLRTNMETNTYRVGGRYSFTSDSIVLGSFMYQDGNELSHDEQPPTVNAIDVKTPSTGAYSGEVQHLFRSRYVNLVSGVGHFSIDRTQQTAVSFAPPLEFLNVNQSVNLDTQHTNLYSYSYVNPFDAMTLTLGASGDFFDVQDSSAAQPKNQFNPKFGFTWNVLPETRLRAAAFRTLKRTLITNQTLEPTQIAGFNQFYDDIESTEAWRYGVAVDQKFTPSIYGGIELSRRNLQTPIAFVDPFTAVSELRRENWEENLALGYFFWTPHDWLALSADYQFERIERGQELNFGINQADTHRVPLGLRFFHPSGISFLVKGTYYNQSGSFRTRQGDCCESGSSTFWIADVALSYRLPRRYGFVSVGATNVLDQDFLFQETDFNNPSIQPDRVVFGRLTLAIP